MIQCTEDLRDCLLLAKRKAERSRCKWLNNPPFNTGELGLPFAVYYYKEQVLYYAELVRLYDMVLELLE